MKKNILPLCAILLISFVNNIWTQYRDLTTEWKNFQKNYLQSESAIQKEVANYTQENAKETAMRQAFFKYLAERYQHQLPWGK